jgi:hypothetical protein
LRQLRSCIERTHFRDRQLPPVTRWQVNQLDRADPGANEAFDRMPNSGKQSSHDVLSPLVHNELDGDPTPSVRHHPKVLDAHWTVGEVHAGTKAPGQVCAYRAAGFGEIGLGDAKRGMGESMRKVPVVGEE